MNNKNMTSLPSGRREEGLGDKEQPEVRVIGDGGSERQEIRGGEEE